MTLLRLLLLGPLLRSIAPALSEARISPAERMSIGHAVLSRRISA
jgi:hypothetical protein